MLSYLDGAKSQISGKSVGSLTGCGWSVTAAAATAKRLQAGLQTIRTDISECRRNISDASKKIVAEEEKVAQRIQTFASGGLRVRPGMTPGTVPSGPEHPVGTGLVRRTYAD